MWLLVCSGRNCHYVIDKEHLSNHLVCKGYVSPEANLLVLSFSFLGYTHITVGSFKTVYKHILTFKSSMLFIVFTTFQRIKYFHNLLISINIQYLLRSLNIPNTFLIQPIIKQKITSSFHFSSLTSFMSVTYLCFHSSKTLDISTR